MRHPEVEEMFAYIREQEAKYNPRWESGSVLIEGNETSYKEAYELEKKRSNERFERLKILRERNLPPGKKILFVDMVETGLAGNENLRFINKDRLSLALAAQTGAGKLEKQEFSAQTMRRSLGFESQDRDFVVVRPLRGGIIPSDFSNYAGVVFSGSEANIMVDGADLAGKSEVEIKILNNRRKATEACVSLAARLHEQGISMLGICFGGQVLNSVFGEKVDWVNALDHTEFETGLVKLNKTDVGQSSSLLRGISEDKFFMHMNHSQEVKAQNIPNSLEVLASSEKSLVQIVERKHDHTILTIQGHPEITDSWGDISLDISRRKPKPEEPFFQGYSGEVSEQVFASFWRMIS